MLSASPSLLEVVTSTTAPSGDPFTNEDILNQNTIITEIKLPGYNLAVEYYFDATLPNSTKT